MELRTLTYFVMTADCGTISAAADRVHVTQPSLSRQLRGLERQLGVELFTRSGRRVELSPAGRALLPRARAVLAEAESLRAAAVLLARGSLERVTLAAPSTTLADIVSPFLTTLAPDDPVPSVLESGGATAEEALRLGADLAIVAGRPPRTVASRALPPLPVWAYLPPGHPWVGRTEVALDEVVTEPLISLTVGHSARRVLDAAVVSLGLATPDMLEATNGTVAQALCSAGRGVAVLSDDARFGLERVSLGIRGEQLSVRLYCVWERGHPADAVLASLAERICAWVVDQYAATGS
jgi:DNA-binding transcriptional LysR family regulator